MNRWDRRHRVTRRRDGISVLETTVAVGLIAVALVGTVQWLQAYAGAHADIRGERIARQEVADCMARVQATAFEALTEETTSSWQVSESTSAVLQDAAIDITIDDLRPDKDEAAPAARRVEVRLSWSDGAARAPRTVALVAWRYDVESAK